MEASVDSYEALAVVEEDDEWTWIILLRDLRTGEPMAMRVDTEQAEDYRDFLKQCLARDLPLVCANPDTVVMRGTRIIPCAGAVADLYESLGGDVVRHGKPYPDAYDTALRHAGDIALDRSVMIGDTFHTDIAGGCAVGMDTIWIAGGIHLDDVRPAGSPTMDRDQAARLISESGENPTYAAFRMIW